MHVFYDRQNYPKYLLFKILSQKLALKPVFAGIGANQEAKNQCFSIAIPFMS